MKQSNKTLMQRVLAFALAFMMVIGGVPMFEGTEAPEVEAADAAFRIIDNYYSSNGVHHTRNGYFFRNYQKSYKDLGLLFKSGTSYIGNDGTRRTFGANYGYLGFPNTVFGNEAFTYSGQIAYCMDMFTSASGTRYPLTSLSGSGINSSFMTETKAKNISKAAYMLTANNFEYLNTLIRNGTFFTGRTTNFSITEAKKLANDSTPEALAFKRLLVQTMVYYIAHDFAETTQTGYTSSGTGGSVGKEGEYIPGYQNSQKPISSFIRFKNTYSLALKKYNTTFGDRGVGYKYVIPYGQEIVLTGEEAADVYKVWKQGEGITGNGTKVSITGDVNRIVIKALVNEEACLTPTIYQKGNGTAYSASKKYNNGTPTLGSSKRGGGQLIANVSSLEKITVEICISQKTADLEIVKVDEKGNRIDMTDFQSRGLFELKLGSPTAEETAITTGTAPNKTFSRIGRGAQAGYRTALGPNGNVTIKGVPAGTWYVVEYAAPEGFIKSVTPVKVNITGDTPVVRVNFTNIAEKNPMGTLRILKTDKDSKEPLSGVEFQLEKNTVDVPVFEKEPGIYTANAEIAASYDYARASALVSDINGEVLVEDVDVGAYKLVETKELPGYKKNLTEYDINIAESATQVQEVTSVAIENETQKVTLKTTLYDSAGTKVNFNPSPSFDFVDKVEYTGAKPGTEYELVMTLYEKTANGPVQLMENEAEEIPYMAIYKFTPTNSSGSVEVNLSVDTSKLMGKTIVAFEELRIADSGIVVGEHKDINSAPQTIVVNTPSIGTTLTGPSGAKTVNLGNSITLTDTVTYKNLNPGTSYSLRMTLMDKATGKALPNVAPVDKAFVPTSTSGSVQLSRTIDTTTLAGKSIVAFEELSLNGQIIAEHKDINDAAQTVVVSNPTLKTTLTGYNKDKTINPTGNEVLTDVVEYTGLAVGKEHSITMTLMDKATKAPLPNVNPVTVKFTPTASSGTVNVVQKIDATALKGKSIVAFEVLSLNGTVIARHEDINDAAQTVSVKNPGLRTTLTDARSNSHSVLPETSVTLVDRVEYTGFIPNQTYTAKLTLMRSATEPLLNPSGTAYTVNKTFVPTSENGYVDVEITIDASTLKGQKIVAFEEIRANGSIVGEHKDFNAASQTVVVTSPNIGTTLTSKNTKVVDIAPSVELVDKITYSGLVPGVDYTAQFTLRDKATNTTVKDPSGKDYVVTHTFRPTAANGSVDVKMMINTTPKDANGNFIFAGKSLVAFEKLAVGTTFAANKVIATHESINDAAQTVTVKNPSISTSFADNKGSKSIDVAPSVTLVDRVTYKGLNIGQAYNATLTVMNKATGKALLKADGTAYTASKSFTPTAADGFVDVSVVINSLDLKGQQLVAFEKVSSGGIEVAVHEDINDAAQTVTVKKPSIATRLQTTVVGSLKAAYVGEKVKLEDTVTYKGLTPGQSYTLTIQMMDKASNTKITGATNTITFSPTTADGSVKVPVTADLKSFAGKSIVAFEELKLNGTLIAEHKDINDAAQTVTVKKPTVGTVLESDNAADTHSVIPGPKVTLKDTVKFTGLNPGETYTLKMTLMDKATGKALMKTSTESYTATTTFAPTTSDGSTTISIVVDASKLAGKSLVAFEELSIGGVIIGEHKDINDPAQTVVVKSPEIDTTLKEKAYNHDEILPTGNVTLVDTVTYKDLQAGKSYTLDLTIMDKSTGKALLKSDGTAYTATKTFTAASENGSVDVEVEVNVKDLRAKSLVAFEKLSYEGAIIATHEDINDDDQTVDVKDPKVATTLTGENNAKALAPRVETVLTDKVDYENLIPGRQYSLKLTLMDKETNTQLKDLDGKVYTVTHNFTPTSANGSENVSIKVNTAVLENKSIVAFEQLSFNGVVIATHEDINDEAQTVTVKRKAELPSTGLANAALVYGAIATLVGAGVAMAVKKRKED